MVASIGGVPHTHGQLMVEQAHHSGNTSNAVIRLLTFAPLRKIFTGTPVPLEGYRSIPALRQTLESHPWRKFWFIRSEDRLIIEPKLLQRRPMAPEFVGKVTGEEGRASVQGRFVFPAPAKMVAVFLTGMALVLPNSNGLNFESLFISLFILLWINIMCWISELLNRGHQRVITDALQKSSVP